MSDNLERSLDEIIGDSAPRNIRSSSHSHRGSRNRERSRERERGRGGSRENNYRDRYVPPRQTKLQRLSKGRPYLKVSDIHHEISEDDLKTLFEKVGETSFVSLTYNSAGRHAGSAYVGYKDSRLNREAIEKFDGRKAVGRVLTVEEIKPLNIGIARQPDERFERRRGGGGNDRGGRSRQPRERRGKPTTEDLDKELEAYMSGPVQDDNNESTKTSTRRPKKTAEDLDKELEDYMNGNGNNTTTTNDNGPFPIAP